MADGNIQPPDEPPVMFYIGEHDSSRTEPVSEEARLVTQNMGYDMLTTPITTSGFYCRVLATMKDYVQKLSTTKEPQEIPMPSLSVLTPEDTFLVPAESNATSLIGFVSPWIDLASPDPLIAHVSRCVLKMELEYAAFCGINNVIVAAPLTEGDVVQYARAVEQGLRLGPYLNLHILLPMTGDLEMNIGDEPHLSELARKEYSPELEDVDEDEPEIYEAWETWSTIQTICEYDARCSIALELPRQLPPQSLQDRWLSEPIRLLMFPHTTFLRNRQGFPVLSKPHQQLLSKFARLRFPPWLFLCDIFAPTLSHDPTPAEAVERDTNGPTTYLQYLRHSQGAKMSQSSMERFGQGYQDYLQSPLQPLADNLESITYEVFEKDPIKYAWYERAIDLALRDLSQKHGRAEEGFVVAVVGAGRGPLVTRALQASRSSGVKIECWAIEKNPNAFVLLQRRNKQDPLWNNSVHVVKTDMRYWTGPSLDRKVDILVSELLGSFADNELSPECLDGVQHVLNKDHGINIPQSYSAHLSPISTPRLHADLLSRPGASDKWELPYVVMLHQFDNLSLETPTPENTGVPVVKEAWSFAHPAPETVLQHSRLRAGGATDAGGTMGGNGSNEHNSRSCRLSFPCQNRGVCHGLAGYFETVLYASERNEADRVELSTNPVTMEVMSKDMISWFPIFFPLKNPIYVPDNATIEVSMWRQTDDLKVWYEWIVEVFGEFRGKTVRLGISALHSSRKNGCVM